MNKLSSTLLTLGTSGLITCAADSTVPACQDIGTLSGESLLNYLLSKDEFAHTNPTAAETDSCMRVTAHFMVLVLSLQNLVAL